MSTLKIWDGRGDRGEDARYAVLPARAADDLRLSGLHLRLLTHMGRWNHRKGWLRISQTEIAERWGVSRQRLNMAIADLVTWLYVEKRSQAETGEACCHYRTMIDTDDGVRAHSSTELPQEDVSPTGDTPQDADVSPTGDTRVIPEVTHVSPTKDTKEDLTIVIDQTHTHTVPKPPCVRELDRCLQDGVDPLVVEQFIAPLLGSLRWPPGIDDRQAFLAGIGRTLAGTPPALLAEAATAALAGRTVWPSAALAKQIVERCQRKTDPGSAAPVRLLPGSPGYEAWLRHYRAAGKSNWARYCERQGYVIERSEYPPVKHEGTP